MFHIDYNLLKSQVALTCVMSGGQATETLDYNNAIYYSKLALDCIVHVLNDKVNKPVLRRVPQERLSIHLPWRNCYWNGARYQKTVLHLRF